MLFRSCKVYAEAFGKSAEASEAATKALREALEARRKKAKPVMPDFLSDGGMH